MDLARMLQDIELLHHAYALEGAHAARDSLLAQLKAIGFDAARNPDAFIRSYESFGIDEGRELTSRALRKPLASARNIFIIETPAMTIEAQNALLKTFEEPSSISTFFLIMPSIETLLPTLRSRMQLLATASGEQGARMIPAQAFLAATPAERMQLLKPFLDPDARSASEVMALLGELERTLAARDIAESAVRDSLRAVYRARRYAGDKGALLKVLLEQVALLA